MNEKLSKILYIDDEEWNLTAFRFMFRDEFEVFTAGDTDAAEKILEENSDIDVVISDQRMPEETGVQFFERMRHRLTSTERIILTGYSDIDAVIASINRAGVYFYLRKPWQEEEVRLVLRNAVDSVRVNKELVEREETLRLVEQYIDELIVRTGPDGHCIYVSPAIRSYCGYEQKEMLGQLITNFLHPDDVEKFCMAGCSGAARKLVCKFRSKDAQYVGIEMDIHAVCNSAGEVIGNIFIGRLQP